MTHHMIHSSTSLFLLCSQESYILHTINVTGQNSLMLGTVSTWDVDVVIKDGVTSLAIDIFSKDTYPVQICDVMFVSFGKLLSHVV